MQSEKKQVYICEVCGKREVLTQEEAYYAGWDYPPFLGKYGVLSPRTCPCCPINKTVCWKIACDGVPIAKLSEKDKEVIQRIKSETICYKSHLARLNL